MTVRRLLLLAPILTILFLAQSYFWVPTYEEQTRGNPERLVEYITALTGDATILNPVLSADASSASIENLVFEGLIDRDEELRFRGRVAEGWEIFEEAYLVVNEAAAIPGHGHLGPAALRDLLAAARDGLLPVPPALAASLAGVRDLALVPPETRTETVTEKGAEGPVRRTVQIQVPARIRLTLAAVDQDLFARLALFLGPDYLTSWDPSGRVSVEPPVAGQALAAYAERFLPAAEHNPVLVFRLRPGVRFHDGHPLTAEDVRFTFAAIMDPKNLSPRLADYEPVKEVEAVDPQTVRVVYKRLYSPALATWAMGILPEHLLSDSALAAEAVARGEDPADFSLRTSRFNRAPVGSGPFVFREWRSDEQVRLVRFAGYWEGSPNYQRYVARIIPDPLTQEMEFYAGTIDSYDVQPHQVARLAADPRFQAFSGLALGYTYIGYNQRRPPFDDPRVRRALGMAVDVDKIIRYVIQGQGEPITGPFPKQTEYYDHGVAPLPFDPQAALALLAEAGFTRNSEGILTRDGKPLRFTLITNSGNDIRKAILTIVQDAWKQIGVDVATDILEWSVFIKERVNKLDFDAVILGWAMGLEPDLYQIWHSSQAGPFQLNFVGFNNPAADELIVRIRQEYDHERQRDACRELHQLIAAEQPYTFLYVGKWTAVLDRRIVIAETAADGTSRFRRITPTKTGSYAFHFNRWLKLPEVPVFSPDDR
ncbi:MAG: ABC transporter substrate-binding protein [Thermodesulfobacteriota bacterium]